MSNTTSCFKSTWKHGDEGYDLCYYWWCRLLFESSKICIAQVWDYYNSRMAMQFWKSVNNWIFTIIRLLILKYNFNLPRSYNNCGIGILKITLPKHFSNYSYDSKPPIARIVPGDWMQKLRYFFHWCNQSLQLKIYIILAFSFFSTIILIIKIIKKYLLFPTFNSPMRYVLVLAAYKKWARSPN